MKTVKYFIIITFISTVLMLVACKGKQVEQQINKVTFVETSLLVNDDVVRYHNVPTVFLAENRANLAFQLSGTVDSVLVKIGEQVEQGQDLMGLYNTNIDPAIESNLAQLESIQAQYQQVKRDVANLKKLRKNNSASKNALEHKQTELKDLVAKEKLTKAQINLAQANQSQAIIKAPFNGVVVAVNKQLGEFVQAGHVVMSIYQQDKLEVEVNVPRALWKNLKLNDRIEGEYNGEKIVFVIIELSQTAESKSHLMKVILQLDASIENAIGQQVVLKLPEVYKNVYQLPLEVVVDDGINQPYIFTVVKGKAHKNYINPLFIENGQITFESETEIKQTVVMKGQSKISQGMALQVSK